VIKFVSDLRKIGGFSPAPPVSSTNKTDRNDITEILLKVALNTNKQTIQITNMSIHLVMHRNNQNSTNVNIDIFVCNTFEQMNLDLKKTKNKNATNYSWNCSKF
jgi:archaellin